MAERLSQDLLFRWLSRPFAELSERVTNLRQAVREQVEAIRRLLAERETLVAEPEPAPAETRSITPPTSGAGGTSGEGGELRIGVRPLDLRVRSVLVREGTANSVRQEMAEMVSRLGLYHQLDAVSNQAYEIIAASENLLTLMRGDGWVFAHRDILATTEEAEAAIAKYREDLTAGLGEFEQKADALTHAIHRHLLRYQVARYGFLFLLFCGPLIGFWSGWQSGSDRECRPPLQVRVTEEMDRGLQILAHNERLVEIGTAVTGVPWTDDSPTVRIAQLDGELHADLRWASYLCDRLVRSGTGVQPLLVTQCDELLVRIDEARHSIQVVRTLLQEQETLRGRLLREVLAQVPRPAVPATGAPATPASGTGPARQAPDAGAPSEVISP